MTENGMFQQTLRFTELQEVMQKTASEATVMIKSRPKKRQMETERGSKYRGVSKNGKKWQVSSRNRYNIFTTFYGLCKTIQTK